ncbi:hypothetical protein [Curvibacter lanceolatus]|uniref:hypothetical protein n=1 Tax=Curvibacter lanceolatus TaxID=86182 RepID=UPI00037C9FEC|nr:hypothetical protein [Curvibacter lanceolatus]
MSIEQKIATALSQINECLYDHGAGKYAGAVSAEQRNRAFDNARFLAVELRRLAAVDAELAAAKAQVEALSKPDAALMQACDLLSATVGLVIAHQRRMGYEDGSAIDNHVSDVVRFLRPWPGRSPQPPTRQAVPEGVTRTDAGFDWDDTAQHHIPKLTVWFTPVPANAPCDAKGWKDRDALASLLSTPQPDEPDPTPCIHCDGTGLTEYRPSMDPACKPKQECCKACEGRGYLPD